MWLGDGSPYSPIASATVLMLRDAAPGLEVFLLKRHGLSDVLGGAYVFPGGKVDRKDLDRVDRLDHPGATLRLRLGEDQLSAPQAAALYVAAIREAFEESGVLFSSIGATRVAQAWAALRGGQSFDQVLDELATPLAASRISPWARWVTPVASRHLRKHFDARFFVAAVPEGQQAVHDEHEATESVWLTPERALHEFCAGRIQFPPPQVMSLAELARHPNVASVMSAARSRQPPRIQPEAAEQDDRQVLCFPGDALHSVPQRAMPGLTRLHWDGARYGPEGGLSALLR